MTTLKDLQNQKQKLEADIAEKRAEEVGSALEQIRSLCIEYGITPEELAGIGIGAGAATHRTRVVKSQVMPKYRNPTTGDTWSGRGKPPLWIKDQERTQFLIASTSV